MILKKNKKREAQEWSPKTPVGPEKWALSDEREAGSIARRPGKDRPEAGFRHF